MDLQTPEQRHRLPRLLKSPATCVLVDTRFLSAQRLVSFRFCPVSLRHKMYFKTLVKSTHSSIYHLISHLHLFKELSLWAEATLSLTHYCFEITVYMHIIYNFIF